MRKIQNGVLQERDKVMIMDDFGADGMEASFALNVSTFFSWRQKRLTMTSEHSQMSSFTEFRGVTVDGMFQTWCSGVLARSSNPMSLPRAGFDILRTGVPGRRDDEQKTRG